MNCIELAVRRYRDFVPLGIGNPNTSRSFAGVFQNNVNAWLKEYVIPAIDELRLRPTFRDHTLWPQNNLVEGKCTPQRAKVNAILSLIQTEAKHLLNLAGKALVRRELIAILERGRNAHIVDLDSYLDQLNLLASGQVQDLVCIDDYFGAMANSYGVIDHYYQDGSFITQLHPDLFHVCDCVTKCMMKRAQVWQRYLSEFRQLCIEAIGNTNRNYKDVPNETRSWTELNNKVDELFDLCCNGRENRQRDACMTLLQVYVASQRAFDTSYLGVANDAVVRWRDQFELFVRDASRLETADRIAAALGEAQILYRDMEPDRSEIEMAIATGGLVIVDQHRTKEAHWEGRRIELDHGRFKSEWEFLFKLAHRSKRREILSSIDLYERTVSRSVLPNRKRRLSRHLPGSLHAKIIPGESPQTYRFDIPRNLIFIFSS